ncbi:MAG: hypothetical protein GVY26_00795 [Bacteroidetes bacterium]|jgi:hypothetical protein|nr:hypothetical protein [Bacteroidota bacterium]
MKDNVHLRLLRSLQANELRRLKLFLRDRWPDLHRLLERLSRHKPDYAPENMDPRSIYEYAYPDAAYDAVTFSKRKKALSDKIVAFLLQEEVKDNTLLSKRLLMQRLAHRHNLGAYHDNSERMLAELKNAPESASYYHEAFQYHLLQEYNHKPPNNDRANDELTQAKVHQEKAFVFWQLFFALESKNRTQYREEPSMRLSIDFDDAYWKPYISEPGSVLSLLHQLLMLHEGEAKREAFELLFDKIREQANRYGQQEQQILVRQLSNFAIGQYNRGNVEYRPMLFEVQKWAADEKVFIENGTLEFQIFLNIVLVACTSQETSFARAFVEEHKGHLPPSFRTDAAHLATAYIHFHEQQFLEAKRDLENIQRRDYYDFSTRWQSLMLRVEYSLYREGKTDFTEVERQGRAFRAFLKNNNYELSATRQESYQQLIYFILAMAKYRNNVDPLEDTLKELQSELQTANVAAKEWMANELRLLKNKARQYG